MATLWSPGPTRARAASVTAASAAADLVPVMGFTSSLPLIVTSFTSTAVYALCFPSLAPYLLQLDGGSELCGCNRFLGVTVAMFSLAKVVAAPLAGRAVSAVGASATLLSLLLLLVASQLLYALSPSIWPVIVSRALMGAASTTSTVCRTIVADSGASRDERTTLTAAVSAASSLGFVAGPMMVSDATPRARALHQPSSRAPPCVQGGTSPAHVHLPACAGRPAVCDPWRRAASAGLAGVWARGRQPAACPGAPAAARH